MFTLLSKFILEVLFSPNGGSLLVLVLGLGSVIVLVVFGLGLLAKAIEVTLPIIVVLILAAIPALIIYSMAYNAREKAKIKEVKKKTVDPSIPCMFSVVSRFGTIYFQENEIKVQSYDSSDDTNSWCSIAYKDIFYKESSFYREFKSINLYYKEGNDFSANRLSIIPLNEHIGVYEDRISRLVQNEYSDFKVIDTTTALTDKIVLREDALLILSSKSSKYIDISKITKSSIKTNNGKDNSFGTLTIFTKEGEYTHDFGPAQHQGCKKICNEIYKRCITTRFL